MRYLLLFICSSLGSINCVNAQQKTADSLSSIELQGVVVTGQHKPQSLKNSVYQIRVINAEQIKKSAAVNIQQVLNTQLNFRFSNDNALGASNISLLGMGGRNIKILIDGVPMLDRSEVRESLNQININTVEKIEIVEGPMAVNYGTDALAGVINIITKKNNSAKINVTAKVQEETVGKEYHPFNYKGLHTQSIALSSTKNKISVSGNLTHNEFGGFGGDEYGRGKNWQPKEQFLYGGKIGFTSAKFNAYYKLDKLDETITIRNAINYNTLKAIDQRFITDRLMHQLQGSYTFNNKWQLSTAAAFTNYSRRTKTTRYDFEKGTETLTTGDGEQDVSSFKNFLLRNTAFYQASKNVTLQMGTELTYEKVTGQRVEGNPSITDVALFASAEIKEIPKVNIRPGLRFSNNSQYKAPAITPSLNIRYNVNNNVDVRASYGYGFRAPSLRELYFYFVDANHNIVGNRNLKAEYSNSFSASVNWKIKEQLNYAINTQLTGFYNTFNNQIDFALASSSSNQYTYFNINQAKTTGFTWENKLQYKKLQATLGVTYTGFYRKQIDDTAYVALEKNKFLWSPEVNAIVTYSIDKIKTQFNLLYKFTGVRPQFVYGKTSTNNAVLYVAKTSSFNWADITAITSINKWLQVNYGVKNIFNIVNVNNSATVSGGVHSGAGAVAIGNGTSYFVGLLFNYNKK